MYINISSSWKSVSNVYLRRSYTSPTGYISNGVTWSWDTVSGYGRTDACTPKAVCGGHTFCKINSQNGFGIDNNNKSWGWGGNSYGDIGDNTIITRCTPVAICGNHTFNKIFTCHAIDNHGQAWGWGAGPLGDNTWTNRCTPVAICGGHTFCEINNMRWTHYPSYYRASIGVDINGIGWQWGSLTFPENLSSLTPITIYGGHTFSQISYGYDIGNTTYGLFAASIDNHGQAWGWGYNKYGELGDNTITSRSTPVAVCGNHTFIHISANANRGVSAIDYHGKTWSWGLRTGNNALNSKCTPVAVCGNHTFVRIYGIYNSIRAIDNNGKMWTWGQNYYSYELGTGDGNLVGILTPKQVYGNHTFGTILNWTKINKLYGNIPDSGGFVNVF